MGDARAFGAHPGEQAGASQRIRPVAPRNLHAAEHARLFRPSSDHQSPMTPGESPDRGYKWLVVGMLWFVCFFNYADRQAIFAVFPLIKQQMGLTDVQLGIVGAAFMWMYALFGPPAGWLCDRFPRKILVM